MTKIFYTKTKSKLIHYIMISLILHHLLNILHHQCQPLLTVIMAFRHHLAQEQKRTDRYTRLVTLMLMTVNTNRHADKALHLARKHRGSQISVNCTITEISTCNVNAKIDYTNNRTGTTPTVRNFAHL